MILTPPQSDDDSVAAKRYGQLVSSRHHALEEANKSALLTIPYIAPDTVDILQTTDSTSENLPKPWQSLGARGVNTLAAKLLLVLLPPSTSFMRYKMNPKILAEANEEEQDAIRTALQEKFAKRESHINDEVEDAGHRVKWNQLIKGLLIAGNEVMYMPPKRSSRLYHLNAYVCRRDTTGNLLELITVDVLDRASLTPVQQKLMDAPSDGMKDAEDQRPGQNKEDIAHLYTHVVRSDSDKFFAYQELNGRLVPDSVQEYDDENLPWLVLRFTAVDGQNYGRGFVEDYRGDLLSLDELSKSLVFAALNAARLIMLVKRGNNTKIRDLEKARNGQFIHGEEGDVKALTLDKNADMRVALEKARDLESTLAADFMLNRSFQRQAERVTAEEIRRMAQELEDTLGGTYSTLAQDGLLPFARQLDRQMVASGKLRKLPEDAVRPTIVTGLSALGRGHDYQRLQDGLATLTSLASAGFAEVTNYVNTEEVVRRIFLGTGTDVTGLVKTTAEVQEAAGIAQQQQQAQELAKAGVAGAAGPVAQGFVDVNIAGTTADDGGAA